MAARTPKKSEKTVYAIKQSAYDSPSMLDKEERGFVTWGVNNCYWTHLSELQYNSPSHASCINGIVRLAYGDGLQTAEGAEPEALYRKMNKGDIKRTTLQFYKTNKIVLQVDYVMTDGPEGTKIRTGEIAGVFYMSGERIALGKKNKRNKITHAFYCAKDWKDKRTKKTPYPLFGMGTEYDQTEIFFWQKPFDTDAYYGPVDYQGGINYAELEIETATYHINLSHNGFTPSALINLNNGIPDAETRRNIISDIVTARTGSENAGKIVVLFNKDSGSAASIEPYQIPDAHKQYEFISDESMEKIFLSHNITSPLLLGIRDTGGGLGANSEELKEAYNLFNLMVLDPLRENIIDCLTEIFPVEMQGVDFKQFDYFTEETIAPADEQAPNTMMKAVSCSHDKVDFSEDSEKAWIEKLKDCGEILDEDEFELWFETDVTDVDEERKFAKQFEKFDKLPQDPKPQDASVGNTGLYKIRYAYGPIRSNPDSREFCKFMEKEAQAGKVYRREDIDIMSNSGVNGDFAPEGRSTYDIFAWKGGAYCHHKWMRRVYFRKRNTKGQFKPRSTTPELENDKRVSIPEAERAGVPFDKLNPQGIDQAETAPINTPTRGSLKNS